MPRFKVGDGFGLADGPSEATHVSSYPRQNAFASTFPNNELPFGGSGWRHGFSDGTLWNNIRTTPGLAFGTQIVGGANFLDSIACHGGYWFNDQTITSTVSCTNLIASADAGLVFEEVELLLRFSIDQGQAKGYEITFSVDPNASSGRYVQINRWDGGAGNFTQLLSAAQLVNNGDALFASIVGTVITVKINGTTVTGFPYDTASDGTKYASGAPGIGHYYTYGGAKSYAPSDYGLTNIVVTAA